MSKLPLYKEFQAIHDNLAVIDRDLSNFPPELAGLQSDRTQTRERLAGLQKEQKSLEAQRETLTKVHASAERQEAVARASVKGTTSKSQYAAALRDLGEREHQTAMALRPLKEVEARLLQLQDQQQVLEARLADQEQKFTTLHQAFLQEHENQVAARKLLEARRLALQEELGSPEVNRLNKLMQARQGKAVVPLEGGTCSGCRIKLRAPFLARFREEAVLPCETCQRLLFDPSRHA